MPNPRKDKLGQKPSQATVSLMTCFYKNIWNAFVLYRVFSEERVAPGWNHPCVLCPSCIKKKNRNWKRRLTCIKRYTLLYTRLHCIRAIYLHIKIKKRRVPFNNFYFKGAWPSCKISYLFNSGHLFYHKASVYRWLLGLKYKKSQNASFWALFWFFAKMSFSDATYALQKFSSELGPNFLLILVTFELICKCLK